LPCVPKTGGDCDHPFDPLASAGACPGLTDRSDHDPREGMARIVKEDRYYINGVMQIDAAKAALDNVALGLWTVTYATAR